MSPRGMFGLSILDEVIRWQGLRELGYIEHENLVLDERYAYGRAERLADLAAELVRLKPDALMTIGTPASLAAQRATTTLPIVFIVGDPVGSKLVASLSRPGANLTGLAIITTELNGKRVELLKEAVPSITRIAVLSDVAAAASYGPTSWQVIEAAAKKKAIQLIPALDIRSVESNPHYRDEQCDVTSEQPAANRSRRFFPPNATTRIGLRWSLSPKHAGDGRR